jgi:hypothetical protein
MCAKWRTHTKFLPKRSYQNVPTENKVPENKVPEKRLLAIKFLYQKVPKNKWLLKSAFF